MTNQKDEGNGRSNGARGSSVAEQLLGYAFEHVGGLHGWLGDYGGGEGVALCVAVLFEDEGDGSLHERGLRGVGLHGLAS